MSTDQGGRGLLGLAAVVPALEEVALVLAEPQPWPDCLQEQPAELDPVLGL